MIPLLLVLSLACADPAPAAAPAPPVAATSAPVDFVVQGISIAALVAEMQAPSAKPRLYNFWATWCGPCVAEVPALVAFAASHPEVEVVLVNVDLPKMRDSHVVPFLKKRRVRNVRNLGLDADDPAGTLLSDLPGWPDAVPVTMAVNSKGRRVKQYNHAVSEANLMALAAMAQR